MGRFSRSARVSLVAGLAAPVAAQPTAVTMLGSGTWSNPANWSSNPVVPHNGQPGPADTYAVTVTNKGITLDQDVTLTDFVLAHGSGGANTIGSAGDPRMLMVERQWDFTQGVLGGNTTFVVAPGGQMNFLAIPPGQAKQLNATLQNKGLVTVSFLNSIISSAAGTRFENKPGAIVQINHTLNLSDFSGVNDPVIENEAGAVINYAGVGSSTWAWEFNNHGEVNVTGGSLNANRGGSHTGQFNVSSGRSVTFGGTGRTHTFSPDSSFAGEGTAAFSTDAVVETPSEQFSIANLRVTNGDVRFASQEEFESFIDALDQGGGKIIGGTHTVAVHSWSGGEIACDAVVLDFLFGTLTENPSSPRELSGTLTNNGLANLRGNVAGDASSGPATLTNNGTFKTVGTSNFSGTGRFVNQGVFEASTGTTTMQWVYVPNDGATTRVKAAQRLIIQALDRMRGTIEVEDEAFMEFVAADPTLLNAAGVLLDLRGDLNIVNASIVLFDAASTLKGTGSMSFAEFANFGRTAPGNSPGTLKLVGDYRLGESSVLEMELGAPGSAEVDRLEVEGDFTLDGTVEVVALPGFGEGIYVLVTSTGTITDAGAVLGPLPGGFAGEIELAPGEVRLVVTQSGCAADLSGSSDPNDGAYGVPDGAADSADFFYYLDQFVAGNVAEADLTGSSDPNSAGYGVPNGSIDADDFFFFLDLFVAGC